VGGIRYLFNTSIYANFSDVFGPSPEVDIVIDHDDVRKKEDPDQEPGISPEPIVQDEVFNIPGNYYGYDMAKNLCSAYGARLAKYDEVEDAYENGAEWCNYGWSEGQMALFPTQQDTFNKLQKVEGHEHDCGRPGINGGFMANPKVKYGVNTDSLFSAGWEGLVSGIITVVLLHSYCNVCCLSSRCRCLIISSTMI
jgi:hypothetical protein